MSGRGPSGDGGLRSRVEIASDAASPRDAMIPRLPPDGGVWSEDARLGHWLEIEILVAEALAGLGVVPDADAREVRASASFDAERVAEVERVTRHDVAAFVQVVGESVGTAGRWVHFGLTSSDVLDTGLALHCATRATSASGRTAARVASGLRSRTGTW